MTKTKTPMYLYVYNDIISKIKSGEYKVGDKLPTEMELTKIYGVSRITISHALKILAEINLVYRVKHSGTFINGKINHSEPLIVPVILPFEENFNETAKGVQSAAIANNVFTPFYNSRNNINKERNFLTEILKSNFDGLIVYPCAFLNNIDLYAAILSKGIPIVCIDRNIEGLDTPLVTSNNAESMKQIANKLVRLGHKKIGFFSICEQMATTETARFTGFCQGIIENGIPLNKDYIFNTTDIHKKEINLSNKQQQTLFIKYVKRELERYLSLEDKPSAICCLNDTTLETLCSVAKKMNIRIPEDLTVTGFDCFDAEKTKQRGFISVKQDFFGIGNAAMKLMLNILDGKPYRKNELVECMLVE